jgi:hypothetical protein
VGIVSPFEQFWQALSLHEGLKNEKMNDVVLDYSFLRTGQTCG